MRDASAAAPEPEALDPAVCELTQAELEAAELTAAAESIAAGRAVRIALGPCTVAWCATLEDVHAALRLRRRRGG
jgi:hypothetical protein